MSERKQTLGSNGDITKSYYLDLSDNQVYVLPSSYLTMLVMQARNKNGFSKNQWYFYIAIYLMPILGIGAFRTLLYRPSDNPAIFIIIIFLSLYVIGILLSLTSKNQEKRNAWEERQLEGAPFTLVPLSLQEKKELIESCYKSCKQWTRIYEIALFALFAGLLISTSFFLKEANAFAFIIFFLITYLNLGAGIFFRAIMSQRWFMKKYLSNLEEK